MLAGLLGGWFIGCVFAAAEEVIMVEGKSHVYISGLEPEPFISR